MTSKKRKELVMMILVLGMIVILLIPIVSAGLFSNIGNWFKGLFNIGHDSDLKGELYTLHDDDSFWISCMIADTNSDGVINLLDQGIIGENWHKECLEGKICGDFNDDSFVDLIDFGILGDCWNKGVCVADCLEKECGNNGCEGSCGECDSGESCVEGVCVEVVNIRINDGEEVIVNGRIISAVVPGLNQVYLTVDGESSGVLSEGEIKNINRINIEIVRIIYQAFEGGLKLVELNIRPCVHKTCIDLGKECGSWDDECGNILNCGECNVGESCVDGVCVADVCVPKTCIDLGKECGDDGCGGSCGECDSGKNCVEGVCETQGPIEVDKCPDLTNEIKDKIIELEGNSKTVILKEGKSIRQREFFILNGNNYQPYLMEMERIDLNPSYQGSDISFEDAITKIDYDVIWRDGKITDTPGSMTTFKLDGKVYTVETVTANSVKISWAPENEIDTFYCAGESCAPETCSILGKECQIWDDWCGNMIDCGECLDGKICREGVCEEPIDIQISMATLKDSYYVGEQIMLTDPPDIFPNNNVLENQENILSSDISETNLPESKGYIIQFEDEPILERKNELDNDAKKTEKFIKEHPVLSTVTLYRYWSFNSKDVPDEIKKYSKNLGKENKKVKERVLNEIKEKRIEKAGITGNAISNEEAELEIMNEFKNVFNGIALEISSGEAKEIEKIDGVKKVSPNLEVHTTLMDSVPLIQNGILAGQLDEDGNDCSVSGKECLTGEGVTIGIIDTGIDYTHEDLGECFGEGCKVMGGYDFVNGDNDPMDDNGHGTHCAGIAAGNGILKGVAPDAKLYGYKVLNHDGSGNEDNVIAAIERSVDPNQDGDFSDMIDVISLSLGGNCGGYYNEYCGPEDLMNKAIDNAVDAGIIAVIAAGNSGPNSKTIGTPGTARKAITVGATYKKGYEGVYWGDTDPQVNQITSFSSRGPVEWVDGYLIKPDIVAPGALICSARYDNIFPEGEHPNYKPCLDDGHVQLAGTSMATPIVVGAAALLKQKHSDWNPEEIKIALRNTAVDIGEEINIQGAGRVDILGAIQLNKKPNIAKIETNGIFSKVVDIIGTASGENFESYTLYYTTEEDFYNNGGWIELYVSYSQVYNDILYNWIDVSDGDYTLKLVVNGGNQKTEAFNFITIETTKIDYPTGDSVLRKGDIIEIRGDVSPAGFNNYEIEYFYQTEWGSDGISLTNGGTIEVVDGILGLFDTSVLSGDLITDRISIQMKTKTDNGEYIDKVYFWLDPTIKKGWPIKLTRIYDKTIIPLFADLDGDDKKEIVINIIGKGIYAFNDDGTIFSSDWPIIIEENIGNLVVADIDGDGKDEILFKESVINLNARVHAINYEGKDIQGWPIEMEYPIFYSDFLHGDIIISDINNDGYNEVIFPAGRPPYYLYLIVLDRFGNYLQGWPQILPDLYGIGDDSVKISVANMDSDEEKEIVVSVIGKGIYAFNDDGTIFSSDWPRYFGNSCSEAGTSSHTLVTGNLDNESNDEIVVGMCREVTIFNSDGIQLEGWPKEITPYKFTYVPAIDFIILGDVNNDEKPELLIYAGLPGTETDNQVKIYGLDGSILSQFNVRGGLSYPTISNIDDDNLKDILFVSPLDGIKVYSWEGQIKHLLSKKMDFFDNFEFPSGWTTGGGIHFNSILDINNDGGLEIVAVTSGYQKNIEDVGVYVWDLPSSFKNNEWPMYLHDPQHTSNYYKEFQNPQSKVVNNENSDRTGQLIMKLQKKVSDVWVDEQIVTSQQVTIPANNLIKLDVGGDYGWNLKDVSATSAGNYRVYASFEVNGQKIENSWEVSVS